MGDNDTEAKVILLEHNVQFKPFSKRVLGIYMLKAEWEGRGRGVGGEWEGSVPEGHKGSGSVPKGHEAFCMVNL